MRIVDVLNEDGSMPSETLGRGSEEKSSLLSSSPRFLLSRLLASIKPSKKAGVGTDLIVQVESADRIHAIVGCSHRGCPGNDEMGSGSGGIVHGLKRFWKNKCFRLPKLNFLKSGQLYGLMSDKHDDQALPSKVICERAEPTFQNSFQSWENDSSDYPMAPCSISTQTSSPSGAFLEGSSFHFGIGVGLAFILANNMMECNKMAELRKQMEVLLKDIKYEILKREETYELTKTYMNPSYAGSSSNMLVAELPAFHPKSGSENNIDKLEAELEAELELLQLNIEGENWECPVQEFTEKLQVNIESMAPRITQGGSFREVESSREEVCTGDIYGVSPYELERKLHQLIETRQQDQIVELESALERAEKLLHEKEMEIRWWQEQGIITLSPTKLE